MDSPVLTMGENPSEDTVKFPHDVTLTLQQAKFPEETPNATKRVIYLGNFMLTRIRVKLTVINLKKLCLRCFPHCVAHHEVCAWIYQQDPNGMGPWTYLCCPEAMGPWWINLQL